VTNAYKILIERPEEKKSLGKPISRWESNIKMDLKEIGLECMDWIHWSQEVGPLVGSFERGNEPL
jgi:hypothetical protein